MALVGACQFCCSDFFSCCQFQDLPKPYSLTTDGYELMATGCPHHLHRMSNPFLGADFSSSKCYGQLVTSLYFNLISSAPSQLHTFAVFLSPDFFKKMMAINLDLLLPSAPKKCPNCRTKKIKLEGKRGDDGEDKKEKGDVCFMEIVK